MTGRIDRFKAREAHLEQSRARRHLGEVPDAEAVRSILEADDNPDLFLTLEAQREEHYRLDTEVEVSQSEVERTLAAARAEFDEARLDRLIADAKASVVAPIMSAFGLRPQMFVDKEGGPVTTGHNAAQGIFAQKKEQRAPSDYNFRNNFQHRYVDQHTSDGIAVDGYTGRAHSIEDVEVDHVVSREAYHRTGGWMQDKEQRKAFAHDERNLTLTDRGLNRSKGSAPLTDPNVEKRLKTKNGLDKRRAGPKQKRGEAAVRERLPDLGQQSAYYAQTLTASTTGAAVNVGLSQAIGLVIAELAGAIFDEAKDIFGQGLRGGRVDASFFQVLRERITRIAARVLSKWEDAVSAFRQGALAGLVSTVSTWLINWIVTAAAHVVRIIREGTMSLVSAIKLLLWPPEGFTPAQALHEASKVLLTGAVITGGILLDELIAKLPVVQGIPFGGTISSVVVGVVSGFVMVCGVYLLDKLDLFGAIAGQRQDHVFKVLGERFEDAYERAEHHLEVLAPVQLLPS